MGGSIGEGNTTASAEFNIIADPEAADVVFRSGVPITMIGLDVTHQALLDRDSAAGCARSARRPAGSPPTSPTTRSTATSSGRDRRPPPSMTPSRSRTSWCPTSSPSRAYHVAVDTTHGPARGRTVCDGLPYRLSRDGRQPNADVGIVIDRGRFTRLLVDAFARLP